jgi:2-polyprenyl-3-methyl-5-hydroxy-6-metoxy-1,4-benzoquinol methylase
MNQEKHHVCPASKVRKFDNILRGLAHPPHKIFGPHVKPGMHALDVGCGGGFAAIALVRLVGPGGRVVAADVQQVMLDMVSRRAERLGLDRPLEYHLCDPDRIGATGPFHFINAMMMVHETPDPAAFFQEAHSLLHSGGRLLLSEPKGHVKPADFAQELDLAEAAGFQIHARPKIAFCHAAALAAT